VTGDATPDNGMHPTRNSVALIREAWPFVALNARPVMPRVGVSWFMKWSKLKKRVEDSFAESVKGHVQIYSTHYQCSCGRGWITVDGEELVDLSTMLTGLIYGCAYHEATKTECATHPAVSDEERQPGNLSEPGEFSRFDLHEACGEYIHSSVNDSLSSKHPLIVSLAVLNAKVGKGRLKKLAEQKLHPLTRALLKLRLQAEVTPHKSLNRQRNKQASDQSGEQRAG